MVIGTDCIGSYKSNYHTIPTARVTLDYISTNHFHICYFQIFLVTDLLYGFLRREYDLENGFKHLEIGENKKQVILDQTLYFYKEFACTAKVSGTTGLLNGRIINYEQKYICNSVIVTFFVFDGNVVHCYSLLSVALITLFAFGRFLLDFDLWWIHVIYSPFGGFIVDF